MGRKDNILAAIALDGFMHPKVTISVTPDEVSEKIALYDFCNPTFSINQASVNQEGALSYGINSGSAAQLIELGLFVYDMSVITGTFTIERIDLHGSIPAYKNQFDTYPAHTDILYTTPQIFDNNTQLLAWLNSDFVTQQSLSDTWRIITGIGGSQWLFYPNPEHFRIGANMITISTSKEYNANEYNTGEYE